MIPQSFPGRYVDEHGAEPVTWRFEPSAGRPVPGFGIHCTVRGVAVCGNDFDSLEPVDVLAAVEAGLSRDSHGALTACVLTGDLPCTVAGPTGDQPCEIRFTLDLCEGERVRTEPILRLSIDLDGQTFAVADDWFEDGLLRLATALPDGFSLRSCVTCLFSDYSPAGHSLLGIRCHRDAGARYLAVNSKADYWPVPVTEEVPETYLCREFEPRAPGTGYRS
ncbi:hypothetical protein GCM10010441_04510 [Kitasatospora paracochleata]|uniref:Uncharacterized protein n=1 Tax=Kitasatospora paracochleata TaxID=58354 RepID=A0ABT1JAU5_9ACTN|nr:DUF6304 family protein [Kitasatospora paracochleata]MCP2313781.1 hypothetical protein [Kitasatospora paracochleata]